MQPASRFCVLRRAKSRLWKGTLCTLR